jgi:hypothetical protein
MPATASPTRGPLPVEKFSIQRLLDVTPDEIRARVAAFHRLVAFDQELPE